MIKTKYWLSVLAVSIVLLTGPLAISPLAIPDDDEDDDDDDRDDDNGGSSGGTGPGIPISFSWDPNDTSSDPNNLIIITGSFSRMGLLSDTTTDVSGEFQGALVGNPENVSETTVSTTAGTTTIVTTVKAQSIGADPLTGSISIDGEGFSATLSPSTRVTELRVEETFTGSTFSQSLVQEKLTIPVAISMCNPSNTKCFTGFGIIREESSTTSSGGSTITFSTDELEAEIIGDTGLFKLTLSKLQRTIVVASP